MGAFHNHVALTLLLAVAWSLTRTTALDEALPPLPEGDACFIGGFIRGPQAVCATGLSCVINRVPTIPDVPAGGICKKPDADTCFDSDAGRYYAPNTTLGLHDCGPCSCAATGGQIECATCVLKYHNCYVGGFRLNQPPCASGLTCVLKSETEDHVRIPDLPLHGNCLIPNSNTCYDESRNLTFAPKATVQRTECGPCRCAAKGGKLRCKSCVREGGNCRMGGNILPSPLLCQEGTTCVINNQPQLPDIASTGTCKVPDDDTCYNPETERYLAPNTSVPLSSCGACTCPETGGELECESCILDGGVCTIGGRFLKPPLKCMNGSECVLFEEGMIAADVPAIGNCQIPSNNTCFDSSKQMYFQPNTTLSNGCGSCECPLEGGVLTCTNPMVECLVDPCMGKTCGAHPGAQCVVDYCGGCNHYFTVNGLKVTC